MNRRSFLKALAAVAFCRFVPSRTRLPQARVVDVHRWESSGPGIFTVTMVYTIENDFGAFGTTEVRSWRGTVGA